MRVFILVSHGFTTSKIKDFYKAGRLDIALHSIIHAFFISNGLRKDVEFNLLVYGPP
jgi:tRNA pseudouridine-54 N-methylase